VTPVVLPIRRALRQISAHKTKLQTRLGQLAAKSQISILGAQYDSISRSANNPMNPAPDKDVVWGGLTSQEMILPWFGVVVEGDVQPDMIASYKPGDFDGPIPQFTGSVRKFDAVAQPTIFRQVK
jgi:hypothetical protein